MCPKFTQHVTDGPELDHVREGGRRASDLTHLHHTFFCLAFAHRSTEMDEEEGVRVRAWVDA